MYNVMIVAGIVVMIYAWAKHRRRRKGFQILAYWNSLSPKGTAIYTLGLLITAIGLIYKIM